jgi:hypothetical protein
MSLREKTLFRCKFYLLWMFAPVICMAIANVGVTGYGLHFRQNGTAMLHVELSWFFMCFFKCLTLRNCLVFPITNVTFAIFYCKERHALNAPAKLDFKLTLSARALSATDSWLTLLRVSECAAETDCTEQYCESCWLCWKCGSPLTPNDT